MLNNNGFVAVLDTTYNHIHVGSYAVFEMSCLEGVENDSGQF